MDKEIILAWSKHVDRSDFGAIGRCIIIVKVSNILAGIGIICTVCIVSALIKRGVESLSAVNARPH